MNERGKTLTIFLVLISVLLLSLTVIAMFFFQKESEMRKLTETKLEQSQASEAKLQGDLKEAKKRVFLLEEKAKEAEEKISDLQSDLELAQGVRDQIKQENATLREALESETQSKEQLRSQMDKELTEAKQKVSEIETQLESEKKEYTALEDQIKVLKGAAPAVWSAPAAPAQEPQLQPQLQPELQPAPQPQPQSISVPPDTASPAAAVENPVTPVTPVESAGPSPSGTTAESPSSTPEEMKPSPQGPPQAKAENGIQLGTIVVTPDKNSREGKILSVDQENDFLIFDLGEKNGISEGTVMSIYRGKDYLGDVKVSNVQPDMAAADFIPPFSSQKVRKSDQIVIKK